MPAVASLTDFNRNQNAVLADLRDTQKPMYLTKNGKACAVIMDAEAFDRMMAEREDESALKRSVSSPVTTKWIAPCTPFIILRVVRIVSKLPRHLPGRPH